MNECTVMSPDMNRVGVKRPQKSPQGCCNLPIQFIIDKFIRISTQNKF